MICAAIRYNADEGMRLDRLFAGLVEELRADGIPLSGVIQHNTGAGDRRCCAMVLEELTTGKQFRICPPLPEARADCRIDEAVLARAVAAALGGMTDETRLVIINKFGKREAAGRGFATVLRTAAYRNIPVLIGVNEKNARAWNAIAADERVTLPPDPAAVREWWQSVQSMRHDAHEASTPDKRAMPRR